LRGQKMFLRGQKSDNWRVGDATWMSKIPKPGRPYELRYQSLNLQKHRKSSGATAEIRYFDPVIPSADDDLLES
jgi:hypothetical protein